MARKIFFISDSTGLTAEAMGRSLLSQFEMIDFEYVTIPYVKDLNKAQKALDRITTASQNNGERPIIFSTLVNPEIRDFFHHAPVVNIDFFQTFINPLEEELKQKSTLTVGRSHSVKNYNNYMTRINAVNFSLAHDDGLNAGKYEQADVILIGVSRCGKTPSCLYLALQFGIFAANYPLTDENMEQKHLPEWLAKYRNKLFGLTIDPMRLQIIRQERFPNKDYASMKRCEFEVKYAEQLFKREDIPCIDTSTRSIEEIAAEIMTRSDIKRRID